MKTPMSPILDAGDAIQKARSLIWTAIMATTSPDANIERDDAVAFSDTLDVADNLLLAASTWLDEYRAANGGKPTEARPN